MMMMNENSQFRNFEREKKQAKSRHKSSSINIKINQPFRQQMTSLRMRYSSTATICHSCGTISMSFQRRFLNIFAISIQCYRWRCFNRLVVLCCHVVMRFGMRIALRLFNMYANNAAFRRNFVNQMNLYAGKYAIIVIRLEGSTNAIVKVEISPEHQLFEESSIVGWVCAYAIDCTSISFDRLIIVIIIIRQRSTINPIWSHCAHFTQLDDWSFL